MDDAQPKPIDLDKLKAALAYWQRRLRLQDWRVTVKIVRKTKLAKWHDAELGFNLEQKSATIYLMDPHDWEPDRMLPYHPENSLVHELIHLHLAPFDPKPDTPEETAQEQAINCLTDALVTWPEPFSQEY